MRLYVFKYEKIPYPHNQTNKKHAHIHTITQDNTFSFNHSGLLALNAKECSFQETGCCKDEESHSTSCKAPARPKRRYVYDNIILSALWMSCCLYAC